MKIKRKKNLIIVAAVLAASAVIIGYCSVLSMCMRMADTQQQKELLLSEREIPLTRSGNSGQKYTTDQELPEPSAPSKTETEETGFDRYSKLQQVLNTISKKTDPATTQPDTPTEIIHVE